MHYHESFVGLQCPEHLAVVRVGGSVVSAGIGVWAGSIVELGCGFGAGNRDWSGIGTRNWCGNSQGNGEEGGENNNQLEEEIKVVRLLTLNDI